VAACVGGGSNAIGIFHAFLDDEDVALWGFEAAGDGVDSSPCRNPFDGDTRSFARCQELHASGCRWSNYGVALDLCWS